MKIIGLNWKLNPQTEQEALEIATLSDWKNAIIFPPAIFLRQIVTQTKRAKVGAQNVYWQNSGAFTGEISPLMARDEGASFALVGHSERRRYFFETDQLIHKKIKAILSAGLGAVLCVGELKDVHQRGLPFVKRFLFSQLKKDLDDVTVPKTSRLIVAYEPIWAIGSGVPDDPNASAEIAQFLKNTLLSRFNISNPAILYGGSVNSGNIREFLKHPEIDGVLIGGASVEKRELKKIAKMAPYVREVDVVGKNRKDGRFTKS